MTDNSEADQLLDQLFRELADGICLSDSAGRVIYMNEAALRLLEVPPEQTESQSICSLICGRLSAPGLGSECLTKCPLRQVMSPAATFSGRYELAPVVSGAGSAALRKPRWKDLRVHCVRVQTTLFDSWEPDKRLTVIEDATSEMDHQRHKEDWRNMIAHDLRTPLASIFGTLRLIEEAYAASVFKPDESQIMANSIRACKHMVELLDLYLDVAKLDAGLMTVRAETVDLGELARKCVEQQEVTARERGVAVSVSMPRGLKAKADQELLFRVLQNLLSNALKFTPRGGRVDLPARRASPDTIELSVTDNGAGIPRDDFPRIFDRFFQADSRREGKTKGTGLGLTFCREAVLAMKGEIFVQSIAGLGTQFVISLLAAQA
ncbi:MAG: PAS domain-containing sensor histidine kinase [Elusimicrobia bacterium]|nr:PAS domain-containing sensor histidine kinase [Elusimicrobiota bacterium]